MKFCCDILDRAVTAIGSPVKFDRVYREVSLQIGDCHLDVLHCPFCGRSQPESLRATFFSVVTPEESERVVSLLRGCSTKAAVVERLGPSDWEHPGAEFTDTFFESRCSFPPTLVYKRLSETADLRITFSSDGAVLSIVAESRCLRPPNA